MEEDLHADIPLSVPHPELERFDAAGGLLRALTAPIRLAVIDLLADQAYCVHELVDAIGAPQPLVSQHLRVLRGAGLVRTSRRGREVVYELTDVHAAHIVRDAVAHASEAAWERNPLSPLPQGRRIRNVSAAWTEVPAEFRGT
jgi:DNA-binding transcriptional ArsR family regulator